jgi:uncharacterized membrane protein
MKTVLDVLHVLAAVFLVGPMAGLPMSAMRALRSGDRAQLGSLARSTNVFSLASLLVVVFGFGVMGMSDPKYHLSITTSWILTSLVLYLVALAVNLALVVPALREAAAASTAGASATGEGAGGGSAGYQRIAMGSGLVSVLLVVVVILMVWKP